MKTLSVANQKGGAGKSTLAARLAYAAMDAGHRELLVDMDSQGSLSLTFPPAQNPAQGMVSSSLFSKGGVAGGMQEAVNEKLPIIRADNGLPSVGKHGNGSIRLPKIALRQFSGGFDTCLADTPPLLGIRLLAALAASKSVATPVSAGLYELAGVAKLMETIRVVRGQGYNPGLRHLGILPMKTNTRNTHENRAMAALWGRYHDAILPETLAREGGRQECRGHGEPGMVSHQGRRRLLAAKEWRTACKNIIGRHLDE
jgi:chromosome partitioning protein